jgi:hypothetical protein
VFPGVGAFAVSNDWSFEFDTGVAHRQTKFGEATAAICVLCKRPIISLKPPVPGMVYGHADCVADDEELQREAAREERGAE